MMSFPSTGQQVYVDRCAKFTHTLRPSPVTRHEITVSPFTTLELLIRNVVNTVYQVWVREDVVYDFSWIAVPELILGSHPLRCGSFLRAVMVVLGGV